MSLLQRGQAGESSHLPDEKSCIDFNFAIQIEFNEKLFKFKAHFGDSFSPE